MDIRRAIRNALGGGADISAANPLPVEALSGAFVLISGQHVFVESGVHVVADIAESGMGVQVQSGLHVEQVEAIYELKSGVVEVLSGLNVVVESGLGVQLESGAHVVADIAESGMGVQVQSGLHIEQVETIYELKSGVVEVLSGLNVVVESGLGVQVESGAFVIMSGQGVLVQSGLSVIVESGLGVQVESGAFVVMSGQGVLVQSGLSVVVESGLGVMISGQHIYQESGARVIVQSGVHVVSLSGSVSTQTAILPPTTVRTRDLLAVTADSGGTVLLSGVTVAVTVKSLSGEVLVGGSVDPDMPYAEDHGFLLAAGEAVSLDVNNFNKVRVCALTASSGDLISYIGVDGFAAI